MAEITLRMADIDRQVGRTLGGPLVGTRGVWGGDQKNTRGRGENAIR